MVASQARLWSMTETAANRTASNSSHGGRPQRINTPEREYKDKTFPAGRVQQGTGQDAEIW